MFVQAAGDRGTVPEACERGGRDADEPGGGRGGCRSRVQLLGAAASCCSQQASAGTSHAGRRPAHTTAGTCRPRQDEDVRTAASRLGEGEIIGSEIFV